MFNPLEHPIIFSSPKRRTSMLAWHEHFPFGMFLVGVLRPRLLVELGTHGGDSYCCFCQAVSEFGLETKCHAVDTWQGDEQAGYYGNDILNDLRAHHDPLYSGFSELIQSTFDDALSRFADGSIDLLHIDGLHTYEAVRHDFETWLPKVSERGVILFHDTNVMERDFGVWKFWEEVRHGYPNFEFKHGYGLGVLAKRDVDSEILRMFFEAERNDSPQVEMLRHLFHGIGQRFTLDDEKKVFGEWKDIMLKEKDALLKEKSDLIAELHRFQTIAADQHQQIAEQQGRISSYVATIADLQAQAINDAVIRSGVGYRALLKMRGAFTKAFPEASPQRAAFQQMRRLAKVAVRRSSLEASNGTVQELPAYTYEQWIEDQRPTAAELEQQRQTSAGFAYRPLISILTPLYNTPERVLREAIESVLNQTYDNLELCLADGASQNPEVREIVREYAARDSRIKFKFLSSNLGISGNSNAALSLAGGDFIAIFDHDDLLAPNALFEVVAKLNEAPDCDMVYFDEDKISEDGKQRHSPWFKPGAWSPEGLLNSNFLMHSIFRRSLVEEVGGFNPDTDGAQDWDLAFRCTERSQRLAHVPKVLYHWRQMPTSASHSIDAKPWAFQSQIRCVGDHLERLGIKGARVEFARVGELRVLLPNTGAKVSIIIPTKDKLEMLKPCVDSILYETDYADYEVLVVDTGSKNPETWKYYESLGGESRVRILQYSERFNFSAVNNYAARFATGELLLFLNNDTQALSRDWLTELAGWAQYPGIGVVGCKLTRPDNTIQHGGVIMGLGGHCSHLF
ncbi:MAG TPA: glycosyltransferase, partial [Blastocatellia bacterium]|nr:glycosyltransferase [Blastocatellia bacterium]